MSLTNLKTALTVKMEIELERIESGERRLGFGNQFDGTVLEDAIAKMNGQAFDFEKFVADKMANADLQAVDTVTWAHMLADFEVPEISAAWTD